MVNRTQVDFRRKPEEWGNALYVQLGQLIDAINQEIMPRLDSQDESVQKLQNQINLIKGKL